MSTTLQTIKDSAKDLNSSDPVKKARAEEIKRRYTQGLFNAELVKEGAKPVPVPKPKIDLGKAMAGVKQVEGKQSMVPEAPKQGAVGPFDIGMSGASLKERGGDIVDTTKGFFNELGTAGQDIVETATRDDRSLAEKATMIGGRAFSGGSGAIGELFTGLGKLALTQEAEDGLKQIAEKAVQKVADTELVQDYTNWYSSLNPRTKDQIDAGGGFAAGLLDLFGLKGGELGAKVLKEGLEASVPVVKQGLETTADVVQAGARKVDDFVTTSDATLEKRIQEQFQKGVKPTIRGKENLGQVEKYKSNASTAVDVITKNKGNLKYMDDSGVVVEGKTPESLKEFSEAITQTKEQIFKEYDSLAKSAGEQGLKIDVATLSTELDNVINDKALQLSNPEAVKYAEQVKERFSSAGPLTAEEAQNVIKNYNNSLQAFYRNPTPEGLTRNAVDALMVNQVRKSLDQGIEGLTGSQYQALKNQYGALRTIEKDVLNATLRDSRKNVAGLIDFTDILTGGQLVTSLISMNPASMAGAIAQGGIKKWLKYLNDPNTQVKKMFKTSERLNSRDPNAKGAFEASVTEPNIGMSIKSTVTPEKVAQNIDATDFVKITKFLENPQEALLDDSIMQMLETMGISKADEATQVRFLKEVTDIAEESGRLESFQTTASPN